MKIESLLFLVLLAPTVNDCESTEFVENSRTVVEGKIYNKDGSNAKNLDISFTNYINTSVSKTDENGNFQLSLPGTTSGYSFTVTKEVENYTCSDPSINMNVYYDSGINSNVTRFPIPRDITYVKFTSIQLK